MKDAAAYPLTAASTGQRFADFLALTKPRLNFLVVVTAAVGYYLGAGAGLEIAKLAEAVLGIALVAGGAAGLNQIYERETDSLMWRTRTRPLAARRITPSEAMIFSLALSVIGLVHRRGDVEPARGVSHADDAGLLQRRLHPDEAAVAARDAGRRRARGACRR